MQGRPKDLEKETAHALDSAAGGTPIGHWARANEPVFTYDTWEEAVGRIFNILAAVRFQMPKLAAEIDDLRAAVYAPKSEPDNPIMLDESSQ